MLKDMLLRAVPALSDAAPEAAETAEEAASDAEAEPEPEAAETAEEPEADAAEFGTGAITSLSSVGIRKLAKAVADRLKITASAAMIAVILMLRGDLEAAASGGE